jgi:mannose-1-phosphate guanylyltransferase / mannose-6-phosphate isomerase
MTANTKQIHPVILSGGSGTRLWPLSRKLSPKQLLALTGPSSLLHETAKRMHGAAFAKPVIICNRDHRFLIAEQMREVGIAAASIVLEPVGRNTAAAAAVASLIVAKSDPEGLVLLAPSDHVVRDLEAFERAVAGASVASHAGEIVTFGITPNAPETGYGYVQRGAPLSGAPGTFHVARFVEKPDRKTAEAYIASGDYSWNSGMFLFSAATMLREMERLQPAILDACRKAIAAGSQDADFLRLGEKEFAASPSISLDYAVMEHTPHAAIVPVDMGWSDVGSWSSLWEIAGKDDAGNLLAGDVISIDSTNSYLRSDGPLLAAIGVEDLVVIATGDAILVAPRDRSQDVKKVVDELERKGRSEHINPAKKN